MSRREPPTPVRIAELVTAYVTRTGRDPADHAAEYGSARQFVQVQLRTTRRHAEAWIQQACMAPDSPVLWLRVHTIGVHRAVPNPTVRAGIDSEPVAQLVPLEVPGWSLEVSLALRLNPDGGYCTEDDTEVAPSDWLITRDALDTLLHQTRDALDDARQRERAAAAAEAAAIDAAYGLSIARIRALLVGAGLPAAELRTGQVVLGGRTQTYLKIALVDGEITTLAQRLAELSAAEAAESERTSS